MDDLNRRFNQQIQDLHLDERFAQSREALGKHLAVGQKKVSTTINHLWAELEARREARRQQDRSSSPAGRSSISKDRDPSPTKSEAPSTTSNAPARFDTSALRARAPDLSGAQAAVGAASQKAGAYLSSWGAWASERRRGWGRTSTGVQSTDGGMDGKTVPTQGALAVAVPSPGGWRAAHERLDSRGSVEVMWDSKDPLSPTSPNKSPRKAKRFSKGREKEKVIDGIGRLDA